MIKFPVRGAEGQFATARVEVSVHSKLGEPNLVELIGMFAEALIGFCCFDRNLKFTFINNYLARMIGISVPNLEIC